MIVALKRDIGCRAVLARTCWGFPLLMTSARLLGRHSTRFLKHWVSFILNTHSMGQQVHHSSFGHLELILIFKGTLTFQSSTVQQLYWSQQKCNILLLLWSIVYYCAVFFYKKAHLTLSFHPTYDHDSCQLQHKNRPHTHTLGSQADATSMANARGYLGPTALFKSINFANVVI
jgi:hypothetical protein